MEASRDASIPLKLQYIRAYAEGDDFTEANFQHEQVPFDLEPKCVALVLVDVWNLGFGQRPLIPEVGFFGEYNGGPWLRLYPAPRCYRRHRAQRNGRPAAQCQGGGRSGGAAIWIFGVDR